MGAVYQAWDQVLEVAVDVKVVRPPADADGEKAREVGRRFKRELVLAQQVTHKRVVRIHDLGEIDGVTYITMPYVQGADLASILRADGRLPVDRVLALAKEVASGLAAAHDAGIVHRDLKPANIMVDGDGHALIMDFGIARSTKPTDFGMTATGAVVGTVEYMAPEQARGEAVDARADIYSFGLILNDLLLGRRKALGTTAVAELMARMQNAPASVRSIDPAIPASVDALVTKCLQPDPAARTSGWRTWLPIPRGWISTVIHAAMPGGGCRPGSPGLMGMALEPLAACLLLRWSARLGVAHDRRPRSSPQVSNGPVISLAILPARTRLRSDARLVGASLASCAPNSDSRRKCEPSPRIACARCSRIFVSRRMRLWHPPNWPASPTSRARAACCGVNTRDSATRFGSMPRCRISTGSRRCR